MSPAGDERHYVRTVEAAWSRLLGRPAVVSPREFETIDGWRRRGVPLAVVLEVIAAAGKRRSGNAPRALTGLAHAVEEAWSVVAAGRARTGVAGELPLRDDARRAWTEALERCPEGDRLRELLSRLLEDEKAGVLAATLDAALDETLPGAVPDPMLERAKADTARDLESFRGRMSDEEFRKTCSRALADHLRAALKLPRLALTR